jgi:hypothetical protein
MKKVLLSCVILFSLTGCIGPQGPAGESLNWKIIPLTVKATDWYEDFIDGDRFYTAFFSTPEITQFVYAEGIVLCYAVVQDSQIILPYVRHYENNGLYWTRTVDFDYGVGGVNIYVTCSDFVEEIPETMHFSLKIIW